VCEVLGEGSRGFTRTIKRKAYAELGVSHLWIADPDARVLEVFQNQRGRWLLLAALSEEANVSAAPFEELHFDASDLWLPAPKIKTPSVPPAAAKRH
jgi:Uma2 family endonuclease